MMTARDAGAGFFRNAHVVLEACKVALVARRVEDGLHMHPVLLGAAAQVGGVRRVLGAKGALDAARAETVTFLQKRQGGAPGQRAGRTSCSAGECPARR